MVDRVEFEKSVSGPPLFFEKHVRILSADITVQSLLDEPDAGAKSRTFVGKGVGVNSVLALTTGQQQALFAWLITNEATALGKIKKGEMVDIDGIPLYGCILAKNKAGNREARGGGTIKLGFKRATGTLLYIVHFGGHQWAGSFVLATSRTLSASDTGVLTK